MCGDTNSNGGEQPGATRHDENALAGRLLVGRDGEPVGRVRGLLTELAPQTGFVVVEAASGWLDGKQFLLPTETLTAAEDGSARCPFSRKQFEYGPAWRDGEGFVGLDRHRAYWTGLLPTESPSCPAGPNKNQPCDNKTTQDNKEKQR
jgi:hypothetical protein